MACVAVVLYDILKDAALIDQHQEREREREREDQVLCLIDAANATEICIVMLPLLWIKGSISLAFCSEGIITNYPEAAM